MSIFLNKLDIIKNEMDKKMMQKIPAFCALVGFFLIFCLNGTSHAEIKNGSRVAVKGATLIYDTEQATNFESRGIEQNDYDLIKSALDANPMIKIMALNSTGGAIGAADDIADLVLEKKLNTTVVEECMSACTIIFLAGTQRSLHKNAKLGFHQFTWSMSGLENFYEDERSTKGWQSPFSLALWVAGDTQNYILESMEYLISRGVDPHFAIETLKAEKDDMWVPSIFDLEAAGVVNENNTTFKKIVTFIQFILF